MKNRKGKLLIAMGLLLIGAALCLTVYNIMEDRMAARHSSEILEQLHEQTEDDAQQSDSDAEQETETASSETELVDNRPDYEKYPDMEMPVKMIDGNEYVGTLEVPILELELPVISTWSYPGLRIAPCRYKGSIYKGDMIIAAHNYTSHFGNLKTLHPGDTVIFWDVEDNCFTYEVVEIEVLNGTAVEAMESGEWDLTLFTCTYGGSARETIRCERVKEESI